MLSFIVVVVVTLSFMFLLKKIMIYFIFNIFFVNLVPVGNTFDYLFILGDGFCLLKVAPYMKKEYLVNLYLKLNPAATDVYQ